MMTNEGFEVVDQFEVQDLTDVKAEKNLFPVAKDLKVRIAKAALQTNKDKDIYALKLELRTVDGIQGEDGAMARVNNPIFNSLMDLVYGADTSIKGRDTNKWWKNRQHLVEFKNFVQALGMPLSGIKVNDEFLASIVGQEVLVTVAHEAETTTDDKGNKVKTGDFQQKLKGWKKA